MPRNHTLAWNSVVCPEVLEHSEGLMARVGHDSESVPHGQELSISMREATRRHKRAEGSQ